MAVFVQQSRHGWGGDDDPGWGDRERTGLSVYYRESTDGFQLRRRGPRSAVSDEWMTEATEVGSTNRLRLVHETLRTTRRSAARRSQTSRPGTSSARPKMSRRRHPAAAWRRCAAAQALTAARAAGDAAVRLDSRGSWRSRPRRSPSSGGRTPSVPTSRGHSCSSSRSQATIPPQASFQSRVENRPSYTRFRKLGRNEDF